MTMENRVMKMRPAEGGLEIKPGETVKEKKSLRRLVGGGKRDVGAVVHVAICRKATCAANSTRSREYTEFSAIANARAVSEGPD